MDKHERIASWWIHWPDLQWPDSENLDRIKARAEGLAKANVSAAMLFGTHFRWDWLPVFPLLHDYIATVAEELHKYGVKLFDHHSINLVHRYSTREEMRHVMLDSGPHLPFSPTFEAAKTWQFRGKYLNDWRMIDVQTRKPLWFPQYTAEGFCHRNPEFQEAYQEYVKYLIAETGIDGLSADDAVYYMQYNACGCEHCRAELKRRAGIDLPAADDASFWGNFDNPAWRHWVDLRFDSAGEFYAGLRSVLPEGFMLTGCGGSSASYGALSGATDARTHLRGWNYVNMELSGNTPPYKHDKLTVNIPIPQRLVNSSHHQAAAREKGVGAFCTGFAHSTEAANHVWATCKVLGADAWIGTLKDRLGLPWKILNTIPDEQDIVGQAFGFEKNHGDLYEGEVVGQLGVYFSYETRNHTFYGNLKDGYYRDYADILRLLFRNGICPHTVFDFPEDPDKYPAIFLSGVARMTDAEKQAMDKYLASGGKVIVLGPTAVDGCENSWVLPNSAQGKSIFTTVPDGIHVKEAEVLVNTLIEDSKDPDAWQEPREGLYYHPHRLGDTNREAVLAFAQRFATPMPVKVTQSKGYLCTMLEDEKGITVQLLAEYYDVDINHELDSIRTHRSRVNLLTTIVPIGVERTVCVETKVQPTVYTPFHEENAGVTMADGVCTVTLPKNCSYAILRFPLTSQ